MPVCPCNTEKEFDQCCGPYLDGEQAPPTAEALMRSRYTAYTREDYDYVIRTCHTSTRPDKKDFEGMDAMDWIGLEIVAIEAGGAEDDTGMVEFVARYMSKGATFNQHEKSSFVRENGQWYYVDSDFVRPPQAVSEKTARNAPCPCGSGKKFKKCCR